MTVDARYHLRCDQCGTLLQLADPTDLQALLDRAEGDGWALARPAEPFAERQDLCPACKARAEVSSA